MLRTAFIVHVILRRSSVFATPLLLIQAKADPQSKLRINVKNILLACNILPSTCQVVSLSSSASKSAAETRKRESPKKATEARKRARIGEILNAEAATALALSKEEVSVTLTYR